MTTTIATPDLLNEISALAAQHAQFRRNVRQEILRQRYQGRWCLPGTQDALADLDLDPIERRYSGRATIVVDIDEVKNAADYEEARNRVIQALNASCSDAGIESRTDYVTADLTESEIREANATSPPTGLRSGGHRLGGPR